MKMNSQYTIQTIPQNLTKEETIIQMVEVLDHLNAITQDIFAQVNKRLSQNVEKLSSISKRIDTAASKVEALKGDRKAKTVFSSSKYPAVDINRDYVSVFNEPTKVERGRHEVKYTKYISTYEPLSKLQFYHVKMPNKKTGIPSQGLGDIPSDAKCINDLLLSNTGKNVYNNFEVNNLPKGPEVMSSKEYYSTSELGAAPLSISQRSSMRQMSKDTYFYTPKVEELPALDVPWDLPDLPGIADDVRYEIDIGSSNIAPSTIYNQLPVMDLPDIVEVKAAPIINPPSPPPPPNIPEASSLALPEIKAEISQIGSPQIPQITTVDSGPIPTGTVPGPPPPPPLSTIPSGTDSRANLMDAIRKAGGSQKANLRKVNEESKSATTASSGDLMADLHSKLMLRRKGISGVKKHESNMNTSDLAFARMSSIIPPPTKENELESGVSTDDDAWNDDE